MIGPVGKAAYNSSIMYGYDAGNREEQNGAIRVELQSSVRKMALQVAVDTKIILQPVHDRANHANVAGTRNRCIQCRAGYDSGFSTLLGSINRHNMTLDTATPRMYTVRTQQKQNDTPRAKVPTVSAYPKQ